MKLPSAGEGAVPAEKIIGYLLSFSHPDGRGKARFFAHFGFSVENWQVLASALLDHAARNEVARVENSSFGTRYIVEGIMETPDGRKPVGLVHRARQPDAAVRNGLPIVERDKMIRELERVVLTEDMPDQGLRQGDIGTVVLVHRGGEGFEVEFVTLDGETVAVVTLLASQLRPIGRREIAHVRPLEKQLTP